MNLPPGFQLEDQAQVGMNLPTGFEIEQQPTPQPDSLLNRAADTLRPVGNFIGNMMGKAMEYPGVKNSPTGLMMQGMGNVQTLADVAGENVTEKMGGSGIPVVSNPYVAAAAGTLVQNTPTITQAAATPASMFPKTAPQPNTLFKKAASWAGDIPEESVAFRYKNPDLVKNAGSVSDLAATEVPRMANKFDQTISGLHSTAKEKLSKSSFLQKTANDAGGAFTKDEVLGAVSTARKKLGGVYTDEAQRAANTLERVSENLQKTRNTVSQNQVHDLIVDLDREIPWDKVWKSPNDLTLQDKALIDTRTKLDGLLKTKNKDYANVMGPMSDAIQARNQFLKNFGVDKVRGAGYQPGNNTVSRLFGATNEDRLATQRILDNTKNVIGEDLQPKVKAAQIKADFLPDSGGVFNPKGVKQIFGRPAAAKAIDVAGKTSTFLNKMPGIGKVAPISGRVLDASKESDKQLVREYLKKAGGDKARARELAAKDGHTWKKGKKK